MLTNIALYYYLIYTPLQFWPCEAQTHLAMRSFSLPQHGTTAGIFNNKGKAIIEIAHFKANTGRWSTSFSYDFTERLEEGFTMEWRYATTLDQLRPMAPKIRIAVFNYRRLQKRNWKYDC